VKAHVPRTVPGTQEALEMFVVALRCHKPSPCKKTGVRTGELKNVKINIEQQP
jgi:hypothetical protein